DRTEVVDARDLPDVVDAREKIVGECNGGRDDGPRAIERPQLEAQVGIEGDTHARVACDPDRMEDGIGGGRTDRLADAGHMQEFRAAQQRGWHIGWLHAARRGARAQIAERMPLGTVAYEIDAGRGCLIDADATDVDPFVAPQREQHPAELVVAELGNVST